MSASRCILLLASLSVLLPSAPAAAGALEPVVTEVVLGGFRLRTSLAATERTGRTVAEYRYRAELSNESGANASGVVVDVTSNRPATPLRDGLLIFGNVPAGDAVESRDTFSFEHDRTVPFDPGAFSFALRQDAIPDVPDWAGTVGSGGGRADAGQGAVVLDFPPGAVPADTPIRISRLAGGFDGTQVLGSTAHDFGPDGIVFSQPVLLTLGYDDAEIPDGVAEAELSVAKYVGEDLVMLPGSVVDPVANTVTAPVSGFSSFVAAYSRPEPPLAEPAPSEPGGDLDASFGTGGKAVFNLGFSIDAVGAVALDPFGSQDGILLAARSPWISAVRVLPDGQGLDPSFAGNGISAHSVQAASSGQAIAVQPDGRILVAGTSNETPPETGLDMVLLRLAQNGNLDPGFATGGVMIEHRGAIGAQRVRVLPDGRIMVVTSSGLHLYTAQGAPDASFGVDGIWSPSGSTTPVIDALRRASGYWAVLLRPPPGSVQLRLLTAGGTEVDQGGLSGSSFSLAPWPKGLVETPAARHYVVGGDLGSGIRDLFAARFDRSLDIAPSYGTGGITELDFGGNEIVRAVAMQEDGRLLLVGSAPGLGGDTDFLVVRLRPGGLLDTLFGDGGRVLVDFGGDDVATDIVIDRAGRLLVVGETRQGANTDAALLRLLP